MLLLLICFQLVTLTKLYTAPNQTPVQGFPANNTDSQKWVINLAKNGTSYVYVKSLRFSLLPLLTCTLQHCQPGNQKYV